MRYKPFLISITIVMLAASCSSTMKVDETLKPVDLGLSVLWANHNLGASNEKDEGVKTWWNDSVRQKGKSKRESGLWAKGWKTPTRALLDELMQKCKWTWIESTAKGYIVTGPNSNSIFLAATGHGYWSRDYDKEHKSFVSYMYFNSSYPSSSYTDLESVNMVRPVLKSSKKNKAKCLTDYKALNGIDITKTIQNNVDSTKVLNVNGSTWISLSIDSMNVATYINYDSFEAKDGYTLLKNNNYDKITISAKNMQVFSIRLQAVDCESATVEVCYNKDGKTEKFEDIAVSSDKYTDIPAMFANRNETTTITLRTTSGAVTPIAVHFLSSYSKVTFQ